MHRLHAPSPCTVSMHRLHAQSPCTVSMHRLHAPSPCTVSMHRLHDRHAPPPCTVAMHRRHAPSPCTVAMHRRHAPSPCTVAMRRRHAPSPCAVSMRRRHAPSPCLHVPSPCTVAMHRLHAPSSLSTDVNVACPIIITSGRLLLLARPMPLACSGCGTWMRHVHSHIAYFSGLVTPVLHPQDPAFSNDSPLSLESAELVRCVVCLHMVLVSLLCAYVYTSKPNSAINIIVKLLVIYAKQQPAWKRGRG